MVPAFIVTGLLSVSILIFGVYYYFDPMGGRTSTRSSADSGSGSIQFDNQTPITPVESRFSQFLDPGAPTPTVSLTKTVVTPTSAATTDETIPTLTARLSSDRRSLVIEMDNLHDVTRAVYSASYNAKAGVRGASGTIQITTPTVPVTRVIALGTCSKNICVYDEVTTPISVRVTFKMKNGTDTVLTESVQY